MRLLLWGLAAVALFATEPGKRLQKKAIRTFEDMKGKACRGKALSNDELGKNVPESGSKRGVEEEPRIFEEVELENAPENELACHESPETESPEDESAVEESDEIASEDAGSESEDSRRAVVGLDQRKAEELVEKLSVKPSAPEGELKSA